VLVVASVGSTALAYFRPSTPLTLVSFAIAWAFCLLSDLEGVAGPLFAAILVATLGSRYVAPLPDGSPPNRDS
jgi:hypothetical protein